MVSGVTIIGWSLAAHILFVYFDFLQRSYYSRGVIYLLPLDPSPSSYATAYG